MRYRLLLLFLIVTVLMLVGYQRWEKNSTSYPAPYPDLGLAPELTNDTWLNIDQPLRLADQRGKVVLVDMWTFG